ncbi:MAG TPA: hypothetical protein PLB81_04340, partial [Deltaproteobacteria bacterium]|nr:hypothetical protein [Deltaproteobacteria bacterium]
MSEKIVETWLGPGAQDGRIEPVANAENALHPVEGKFYGEWWYFDARLDDGHVVVGFLQASELMTRKPGIELHIYRPSGEKLSVVRSFRPGDLRASEKFCDVWVGPNHAHIVDPGEERLPTHHFLIDADGLGADLTFESELPAWKPGGGRTYYGNRGYFGWVVPVPRARVTGRIRIDDTTMPAEGIGYHDHNVVTADMRRILSRWHWGRLYAEEFTLLYAYVITRKRFNHAASKPLMLAYKDRIILSSGEMQVREGDLVYHATADRTYPKELEITVPGRLSLHFTVREVIDAHDLLADLVPAMRNPVLKAFAKR